MARVKRGLMTKKRHNNLLSLTKGYRMMRGNVFTATKIAMMKAGTNAYRDRRAKKRTFRALWIVRLNNALRPLGFSYSRFIHAMSLKKIELDRKNLSNLAISHPQAFETLVKEVMA